MESDYDIFLEKNVNVELNSGFHLYGIINKITPHGILLESDKETGFISFSNISTIKNDRRGGNNRRY